MRWGPVEGPRQQGGSKPPEHRPPDHTLVLDHAHDPHENAELRQVSHQPSKDQVAAWFPGIAVNTAKHAQHRQSCRSGQQETPNSQKDIDATQVHRAYDTRYSCASSSDYRWITCRTEGEFLHRLRATGHLSSLLFQITNEEMRAMQETPQQYTERILG